MASPYLISAMEKDDFLSAAWDIVGKKVSKTALLSDIYETARCSVGLPVAAETDALRMFRMVLAGGRSLIRQRNEIEARAVELLSDRLDYQLLTSVPGIGPINALTILAEAGDLRRFRHHSQFLKSAAWTWLPCSPASPIGLEPMAPRWATPRPKQDLEVWQCQAAPNALDGRADGRAPARQQLPRQVRTLHRPGPA